MKEVGEDTKHPDRACAERVSMYSAGGERGPAWVQESLESRIQDARLIQSQAKLEKHQSDQRVG